ncbi:MAG: response regulator [bacterium]
MAEQELKEKNELTGKDIKDCLGLACIRKIPVELLYESNRYQCFFNKVEGENTIVLDFIDSEDSRKFSENTKAVTSTFVLDNKRYMFQSQIKLDNKLLKFYYPEVIRPIEARRYYRVEPRPEEPMPILFIKENNIIEAKIEDISAGGLRFLVQTDTELASDEKYTMAFFMVVEGAERKIIIEGIVRHIRRVRLTPRYHCGIQFVSLDRDIRDSIIRFVSERQIEERKRAEGLLKIRPKPKAGKELALKTELKESLLAIIREKSHSDNIVEQEESPQIKKILVIDDDEQSAEGLKALFDQRYEISFDATGLDGINKALSFLPNLIILEIDLKGLDGYKVCQILKSKEQTKDIPILVLSRRNTREDVVMALSSGAVGFIVKPFDPDDISRRTEEILSK